MKIDYGHKLKEFAHRVRRQSAKLLPALWSLRGAVTIGLIALFLSVLNLFLTIRGKLVILPFEVRSEQTLPPDIGASFAGSLASALNNFRELYPASNDPSARRASVDQNSFDLVKTFLADLPFVNIPQSSPLNKGSTSLDSFKIGALSIPIGPIIFEYLSFFHKDTMRGSLELWGDEITASIDVGEEGELSISVPKSQGFRVLINRLAVEMLQRKKWLTPTQITALALTSFTEGLRQYANYDQYGEERFLGLAREKYEEAVKADPNAGLARLHLASTQFVSWDPATLHRSVENFSILRGSKQFQAQAKIGYVAAIQRYVERTKGCGAAYEFLDHALREVGSWSSASANGLPTGFQELVLWGSSFHQGATFLLPNNPCSAILRTLLQGADIEKYIVNAEKAYAAALTELSSSTKWNPDQKKRYALSLRLRQKYLLNDKTDYLILTNRDAVSTATASLDAGLALEMDKGSLSEAQQRVFAPFLGGSIADSYLRLAKLNAKEQSRLLVEKAILQLRTLVASGDVNAARWSMQRLADLELARNNSREGLEWFSVFFNETDGGKISLFSVVDANAYGRGVFLEKTSTRCEAAELFKKASSSLFAKLFLSDAMRRSGNVAVAEKLLAEVESITKNSTLWVGESLLTKITIVRAKLAISSGDRGQLRNQFELADSILGSADLRSPSNFVDLYELAIIAQDQRLLTQLKAAVGSQVPFAAEVFGSGEPGAKPCVAELQ